jgi:glycosyltransferase involved in cell wall biosynthesis
MNNLFEIDPYPGNPKILFIGLGVSTHTHSWIDLLSEAKLNVRLFSVPGGGVPPFDWKTRTYVCSPSFQLPEDLDPITRRSLYPLPQEIKLFENELKKFENELEKRKIALRRNIIFRSSKFAIKMIDFLGTRLGMPTAYYDYSQYRDLRKPIPKASEVPAPEEWLEKIIRDWQPDIIHTLGLFDGQGGAFYFDVRKRFGLERIGKWVLQLRGGSDLALNRLIPEMADRLAEIIKESAQVVTDNRQNVQYLREMNISDEQLSPLIPVPGSGGIDIKHLSSIRITKTSQSRDIIFPKGYELMWSKCLPVLEAFQLCWERIAPCRIHILNATPEVRAWFYALPAHIRESCIIHDRIPRQDFFSLLENARVLLIPSLVDGVPNSLYEAMALGVFPIVSPLETIRTVVEAEKNVLFARNLYPHEIADALTRAMADDVLVDTAVKNNLELVKKVADREVIGRRVIGYYEMLAGLVQMEKENQSPLVTVITPAYNRASFLDETVNSVLSQDYPNIEYIVLDDGSRDNTKQVMEKYRERVIFESHDNIGETRTVNKGFEMAKGEYICVVNSDDPLLPGAITKMVSALGADLDALAVYPDWVEIDLQSAPIKEMRLPDYDIFNMLNNFNVAMGPGNIFKRSALKKYGFRDTNRKYTGDLEFWFRLASHGKLLHIPELLATHRTHPHSASVSDKGSKMAEELLSMAKSLLASDVLPKQIQDKRGQILSHAYYVSTFYCPNEPARKLKYSVLSFLYNPKRFFRNVFLFTFHKFLPFLNGFRRVFRFLVDGGTTLLRLVLPEKTYNALRAWRQNMRKTNR